MPKVSIIIPLYNKAEYIGKTLETILGQKFSNYEIIIVDDGSTDQSSKIVASYLTSDSRIKFVSQSNQGVSVARNKGIEMARGEWLWFVDADDVPSQEFLNRIFQEEISTSIDLIVGNFIKVYSTGEKEYITISEKGIVNHNSILELFMKYQYANGYWGFLWNKLIRRKVIVNNNIKFTPGVTLAEDLEFMVDIYKKSSDVFLTEIFAMEYTLDATNSSASREIDYIQQLYIQKKVFDWIVKDNERYEYSDIIQEKISSYVAFVIFNQSERNGDYILIGKEVLKDKEIYSLLSTKNLNGTLQKIVWLVKNNCWFLLKIYLECRKTFRKFYRNIRRWR